jgi:signal transduction histidine kinase
LNDSIEKLKLERKWRLRFEPPGDLPKVKADPFQLQEVFINIIRNAKEAMKDGGDIDVRMTVSADWIEVSITDTGEGIPEENLGKISEPFFTTKPHGQGVGLGLPICQRIVSNHKGEIRIISKVGKGSTFTVRLPRGEKA